jgi:hypothetical protein
MTAAVCLVHVVEDSGMGDYLYNGLSWGSLSIDHKIREARPYRNGTVFSTVTRFGIRIIRRYVPGKKPLPYEL